MSQYSWPDPATQPLLQKRITRIDGPAKSSGRAKYTYDYNPDGLLAGKIVRCPTLTPGSRASIPAPPRRCPA